ncbi:MAG: proline--tRNA ligase [Rickettsiales bacterium]|nr:proline--tRNA ligase [Rickettsiales bacterium]
MKLSRFLLPILKEDPREAQIVSHRLMLRSGMIRQLASGIYNWLPLGLRVLNNISNIVREEMNRAGALEVLMPTMQPAELWEESGRGSYGAETLVAIDRHEKKLIYGPTNEEVITDIFRNNVKSYKDLPINMYHIQWKFRDEIRPRFGVMRGREFLMKDSYSFDIDEESAIKSYNLMFETYLRIFKRLGLKAIPFRAETGQIGGDLSHEFQIIADTGESQIFYDADYEKSFEGENIDIEKIKSLYARADEMHDPANCPIPAEKLKTARGIEVGHIFYLGEKYSAALGAKVQDKNGQNVIVKMGCYGIGVSRLIGSIIEAYHDEKGIIWPDAVAPFKIILINLRPADAECSKVCEQLYSEIQSQKIEVLYDDTDNSAGAKFATAELIGIPYHIVIGPKGVKEGNAEITIRRTGEKKSIPISSVAEWVKEILGSN